MRRSGWVRWGFLTFLDLITCGLGGAVLLFVISATATPVIPTEQHDRSVLVFCTRVEPSAPTEIGIEWRRAGAAVWSSSAPGGSESFSLPSEPGSGAEAFVLFPALPAGEWEFRPYLRDFPDPETIPGACTVLIRASGERVTVLTEDASPKRMGLPGDTGQVLRIHVAPE